MYMSLQLKAYATPNFLNDFFSKIVLLNKKKKNV